MMANLPPCGGDVRQDRGGREGTRPPRLATPSLRHLRVDRFRAPFRPTCCSHSPFTVHRFIPLPITLPYHAPVPPAGTPIMTVVMRGGTGPRHGANVAR